MIRSSDLAPLLEGIHSEEPVSGLTHCFYKYPARFSPLFTRAAIQAFTDPGEVIYDPFMGGGTTLVEATALGRQAIGTDINSLAVFLADVKTTILTRSQLFEIQDWAKHLISRMNVRTSVKPARAWANSGYQRNINTRETWRIRKVVEIALAGTGSLRTDKQQRFARCIVLRTAQWALDCRSDVPTVSEFRDQFDANAREMTVAAADYARKVLGNGQKHYDSRKQSALCLHRSAVGIEQEPMLARYRRIKLVLTSPPYPGVHVLYHRWQVLGRRETPAPFWIADSLDGNGASYYTFGDRKQQQLNSYFSQALAAFRSVARVADTRTLVVQMVAFSEPQWQLERYAAVMREAGFRELRFPELANGPDGRAWRSIPNRKWYASQRGTTPSSNEVVLFHALSR